MKQKYLILTGIVLSFFMLQSVVLSADFHSRNDDLSCGMDYGIMPIRDNSKVFIIDVLKNSPADKKGLKLGDEIIKINNIKVKNFKSINDVMNLFDYSENITLSVKSDLNGEKDYFLIKSLVCIPKKVEKPLFNTYWHQIYTDKEDLDLLLAPLIEEMNIIKGAIFNSAPNVGDNNNINIQKNNEKLSENKLKIPD